MASKKLGKAVLVTTQHRGVFFGYLVGEPTREKVTLRQARNVVLWRGVKGFLALAESGPTRECRVSTPVPELTAWDVTSVVTCTAEAVEAMERGPWA